MSPNIEKLKHLWKNLEPTLATETHFVQRADQIFAIVEAWEKDGAAIEAIQLTISPKDNGIPDEPWPSAKRNLIKLYEESEELKTFRSHVDDVEALLHVQSRDGRFRISSNTNADSSTETNNTTPTPRNPESYYASYNYPFEIARFITNCKRDSGLAPSLRECGDGKFVSKFLWMLANREKVVPILSIASFRSLSPIFRQIADDVNWGDKDYHWHLKTSDFSKRWPEVSAQLSQRITGHDYAALTDDQKRNLAKLLFIASLTDTTTRNALDMVKTGNKAIILYGPPGTGKTYQAQEVVNQLLEIRPDGSTVSAGEVTELDDCNFSKLFPANVKPSTISSRGCWALIQFHPTYSYHDFIGGIMPTLTGDTLGYERKEGIFKRFCDAAKANSKKPFVLIIDEINRADLSAVFGELMYALEYRNKKVDVLHFGPFEIPDNVYVIGTMNSADKSLVTFDLALRRRFLFFKLIPEMSVLNDWNKDQRPPIHEDDIEQLIKKAEKLNKAVVGRGANELGLPEDYGIGQAYFMKISDFCVRPVSSTEEESRYSITEFAREQLWTYHLEPLLEEYLGAEIEAKKNDLKTLREAFVRSE